jgi:signal transduction histidine kinase
VGRLTHDVARAYESTAEQTRHHLKVDAGSTVTARTDEKLVRRILQNLIRNAIRHTPEETTVVVRIESSVSGAVRLSVADDGPGIPLEIQPVLFEPFNAAAIRSIGRRVDTGLGLASCRAAARPLGTDITIESDGKRGTTFSLELPVLPA